MTFSLKIELGNDAMQDPADVSDILLKVVDQVRDCGFDGQRIFDANGNSVGSWEVK